MRIEVLDHGYVELVDSWGSDERFIEAARMSTGKGFQGWDTDLRLLRYLWTHKHHTPFEMGGITVQVKAPLFVFREWHRHRVPFSYNEMSARYIPLPNENYLPTFVGVSLRSHEAAESANNQARGAAARKCSQEEAQKWLEELEEVYKIAQAVYEHGLELGVPKELARLSVPVARYSVMRASSNIRGWLAFMTLRCATQAQWEIRQYANAIAKIIQQNFPHTFNLWREENDS
jgi:thymidylate synthase (FAD)